MFLKSSPALLRSAIDLFSGGAFRPDPADSAQPLRARFTGRELLILAASPRTLRLAITCATPGMPFELRHLHELDAPGGATAAQVPLEACIASLRKVSRPAAVVLSLGHAWTASLDLPSAPAEEVALTCEEPGAFREFGIPHPVMPGQITFRVRESAILELCERIRTTGLPVARVRLGTAALLEQLCTDSDHGLTGLDLLASDGSSALLVESAEGPWSGVRFASNRPADLREDIARLLRDRSPAKPLGILAPKSLHALVKTFCPTARLDLVPDHAHADLIACLEH